MMVDFIFESSMHANIEDIFYKPVSADEWKLLQNGYYVSVEKNESKSFAKRYAEFEKDILILTAAASKGLEHKDVSFGAAVNTALNAAYYKIFSSKGKQQAEMFLSAPKPETATKVNVDLAYR